jgi:hypothetical protein
MKKMSLVASFMGSILPSSKYGAAFVPQMSSFLSSSSRNLSIQAQNEDGISRLETLKELLSLTGAPGSKYCNSPNDLSLIHLNDETVQEEILQLHPHLVPIAKSKSTGYYVCALRRAFADDAMYVSSSHQPWPIVESAANAPGYSLLALNSEHLMRRIACQQDFDGSQVAVNMYNQNLGQGILKDTSLDSPYVPGSVNTLGYGLSKYCLLRVGPFPDLYQEMSLAHLAKGDESSSLIAAEAANGKFTGFASTFRFYAEMLNKFPNREDETKDAARVCLRMPLSSIGSDVSDYVAVSILAGLANINDTSEDAITRLKEMYDKIKAHEKEEQSSAGGPGQTSLTEEQQAIEDVNDILDQMVFQSDRDWSSIRKDIGDIYGKVSGLQDMANFVDPSRSWA